MLAHLACCFALLDGLAFVVTLLALSNRKLDFCMRSLKIDGQWNKRQSLLLDLCQQLTDLFFLQKEFARAEGIVVIDIPLLVRADVHPHKPYLPVLHYGVTVLQIGVPLTERLDFGPLKNNTGLDPLQDVVVMARFSVRDDDSRVLFGHSAKNFGLMVREK